MDVLFTHIDYTGVAADCDNVAGSQVDAYAFGGLYQEMLPGMYAYIRGRTRSQDDAIDLTHQVFLKALEALPQYRNQGTPLRAWLYRIARNTVIDYHRRSRSAVAWDAIPERLQPADNSDLEGAVVANERAAQVRRLLLGLEPEKRELLLLRFSAGLKFREVALVVGRSEAAVKTETRRVLRALREVYDDE